MVRKSNIDLKLEHKMPIFVDEYYAIKITIDNKEDSSIENIRFSFYWPDISLRIFFN